MMKAVKKGGDRQELHERLREHAVAAAAVVKQEGKPNDMIARVEADPAFGLTREEIEAVFRRSFSADCYLASANAITESGEIFNVDGNSNRVAAIAYGPARVLLVVGSNKIVRDLDEAQMRLETFAAPANAKRLSCKTPCAVTGKCEHCHSPARICCSYTCLLYTSTPKRRMCGAQW